MKMLLIVISLVLATQVFAQVPDLTKLDKLQTCVSVQQKNNANNVIIFLENFKWWIIKNVIHSIHPDYKE